MTEQDDTKPAKEEKSIIVPGWGLNEDAVKVTLQIIELQPDAQRISILNPVLGAIQYRRAMKKRAALRPDYNEIMGQAVTALRLPVQNANLWNGAYFQTLSLGQSLAALTLVDAHWSGLGGLLDRKAAFLVASFSIYLSVVALLVSLIPLWL